MPHLNYLTIIFVLGGAAWFTAILLWPRREVQSDGGPDLSLEWKSTKQYPNYDRVRIKNFGTASAFNIGLRFALPQFSFHPNFEINVLHADREIEREAVFFERTTPNHSDLWRREYLLTGNHLSDESALEIVASFFDAQREAFEKVFSLELGSGGERIKITPGTRKRLQATS